jgi:hypothetical protein
LAALHGPQQGDCVADFVQDRIEHIAVEMMAVHSNTPLQEKNTQIRAVAARKEKTSCRNLSQDIKQVTCQLFAAAIRINLPVIG